MSTDPRWDASLWSAATMAEKLKHLGAVVLDPQPKKLGFGSDEPPLPPAPETRM